MTSPVPSEDGPRPDPGQAAPPKAQPAPFHSEIDAFLHRQRQGIEQWSQTAGEAVRAEVERAVLQGLADAFRRLADDLPRILAGGAASVPALRLAPSDEEAIPEEAAPPAEAMVETACLPTLPAETAMQPAVPVVPEAAREHLRRGRRIARAGDLRLAVTHYNEALHLHPAYLEAHLVRGQAFCDLGKLDLAGADFEEATRLAPHLPAAYLLLGGVRLAQCQWDDCVIAYSAAVRLDPTQAVAFLNRGLAHAKRGDAGAAAADADEALRLNPDMAEAYYLRAVACTRQRKNDQAVADLSWLIAKDPTLWRAYYTRGLAHANEGDYAQAVADFGQVLRITPGFLTARFQRGVAYRLQGEHTYAILEFTRYLQEKPGSGRAHFQRALAYLGKGSFEEAVADFDRAIELDPGDQEARERRDQAVRERDQLQATEEAAVAASESDGGSASEMPTPPPAPAGPPNPASPWPPTLLWLTCPECGVTAQISWKRLNRMFKCRGCKHLFRVDGEGRFSEIHPGGKPPRRWPIKRLAAALAFCMVAACLSWFYVVPHAPSEAPLPVDLKARAELWGKAWVTNDRYMMRRLTDPTFDKALHPWLQRHQPPQLVDTPGKKDGKPELEVAARVDQPGDHKASLVVQVKTRSLKAPVEVRQNWVERGDSWFFVPS